MDAKVNVLNWFEISVANIMRARKFYETVFNIQMETSEMMGMNMASFPYEPMGGKLSGALVQSDMHKPSPDGVKIYLNGNPDLSDALSRVEAAGGKITMPKTKIGDDIGHMAFFLDTEGNHVGLHSQN
ncbi:MAG TPA: VOC family protein [Chitinophagales bacterium]|nr:VOC family protein [Chitinophagales bacterium]